jgi:O-antigen ligase
MPNPAAETPPRTAPVAAPHGWRFAPFYVLLVVALWPAPGYAIALMALGALLAIGRLLLVRFRGGTRLLSGPAWALTSALFAAYWLPEAISSFDAVNHARAIRDSVGDVFFLPFLWLVAAAVANERGRRITFAGLAVIAAVWTLDALLQAATGASALFWALDKLKWIINGRSLCPLDQVIAPGRINGMFGDCNPKLGQVLASLSPFVMFAAGRRFGGVGWLVAASAVGVAILLAGARAAWITYALALLFSGWRVLGWKKLLGVFVAGALVLLVLDHVSPPFQQRVERTEALLSGNEDEANLALSGRMQIWRAAACMVREHPINGVGARNFRYA